MHSLRLSENSEQFRIYDMTNLAHWQDDIDEALVGDFDSSLSGLCIMSLSFDFTRNGSGPHLGTARDSSNQIGGSHPVAAVVGAGASSGGLLSLAALSASSNNKSTINYSQLTSTASNHDTLNENSNHFSKRFKSATISGNNPDSDENDRLVSSDKIVRQLEQFKNCLSTANSIHANASANSSTLTGQHYSNMCSLGHKSNELAIANRSPCSSDDELDNDEDERSCNRTSDRSEPSNSSSPSSTPSPSSASSPSSIAGPRSPSPAPSQSCSSLSTQSHASSRSQSPSDMSLHSCNNNNNNNNNNANNNNNNTSESRNNHHNHPGNGAVYSSHYSNSKGNNQTESRAQGTSEQVSIYSIKDSILNGSTLKESLYTTSVITTTAPMQFKNHLHHPFSIKQHFPPSPHHQFSNSSRDIYDKYLSLDSHQPLQTPLIGIERTQDLLSLKLPPHGPAEDSCVESQRFSKEWPFEEARASDTSRQLTIGACDRLQNQDKHQENNNSSDNNSRGSAANANKSKESASGSGGSKLTAEGDSSPSDSLYIQKGFPFNYKSNLSSAKSCSEQRDDRLQHEPIDLNVSFEGCCSNSNGEKGNNIFNESMKHFNPDRVQQNACYNSRSKSSDSSANAHNNQAIISHVGSAAGGSHDGTESTTANLAHQYHGQESMFGIDPSKQKFQYVLGAPVSVATKLIEDTMTYLNQGQAYEIKLENMTDVAEAKKGFMCSIINIGFYERHMQQAENELWQQWSQQHPNEKIFSVDMKLSYNVFGVESDGLNKYEFLWDSSKAAGVFIRINSISTEFTPKKHGGEKGVPFKLSIETFSYNSKTHDSYFISAACCQIKVFKPKGAERKIRSDRDKISKRPLNEQDKYHRSCDHTTFKECSIDSLHPTADGSLCYYRHSHGHFASKQVISSNTLIGTPSVQAHQAGANHHHRSEADGEMVDQHSSANNSRQQNHSSPTNEQQQQQQHGNPNQVNNDGETNSSHSQGANQSHQRSDYSQPNSASSRAISVLPGPGKSLTANEYSTAVAAVAAARSSLQHNPFSSRDNNNDNVGNASDHSDHNHNPGYGHIQNPLENHTTNNNHQFSHSNELLHLQQPSAFNQMYHCNQVRGVAGITGSMNNSQHFPHMPYYGHSLQTSLPQHHISPQALLPLPSPQPPTSYSALHAPTSASMTPHLPATSHGFPLHMSPYHHHQHLPATNLKGPLPSMHRQFGQQHDLKLSAASSSTATTTTTTSTGGLPHSSTNSGLLGGPFSKGPNPLLEASNHGNSFHNYLNQQSVQTDQCPVAVASHEQKDTGGLQHYQHSENYAADSHLQHSFNSTTNLHNQHQHQQHQQHHHQQQQQQQQPFRQRSASTSLTSTNNHCTSLYMSHGNNHHTARHSDNYIGATMGSMDNNLISNHSSHWMNQNNQSQLMSPNSSCATRVGSNGMNGHTGGGHNEQSDTYNSADGNGNGPAAPSNGHRNDNNNYNDCNNHNFNSNRNSPQKDHQQHTSDSSSSCYSNFKSDSSLMTPQSNLRQDDFENSQEYSQSSSQITANSNCTEVAAWFISNRFGLLTKTLSNYNGSDLLRLSKADLIEICGLTDGIRLYNSLKPKRNRTKIRYIRPAYPRATRIRPAHGRSNPVEHSK